MEQAPVACGWGRVLAGAAALALVPGNAPAGADEAEVSSIEVYGSAQADVMFDLGGRIDPDWDDAFRPSKICIDGACGSDGQTNLSVKQSRVGIQGRLPTGASTAPVAFKLEVDLFGVGEDAGKTTLRLRHAYGEWGAFLAGQTDSLFMDGDVYPNTIDFWGPSGMVFYRNVQVRWTPWQSGASHVALAIERPGNDIDPGNLRLIDGLEDLEVRSDEELPDLTAQWRHGGEWGHVQLGGILRRVGFELRADSADPWIDGHQTGWGVNLAVACKVGTRDRLLLQLVHGAGIASYMNDGGMDLAPRAIYDADGVLVDVDADAVPLTGVLAYYDHYWNDRWSSSVGYSQTEVDNTNFQDPVSFHRGQYASANLLYAPVEHLLFGVELLWGQRTDNGGASDDDVRVQFTARYGFRTTL